MQRLFTSGSRQAPDPFDQFLEQNNYYRKHTARDSSCLFRVISEQMYDTQIHHLEIRKKCVRYMRKHSNYFATLVDRDIDEYLDDLSKPKTYGSLVELQALCYIYQRKVILFEPFTLGNFLFGRSYYFKEFRVFYSPERHFDSVFTCDYIKDAAFCQSICYEILYKDLFKLPDVNYAVEKMLHADASEGRIEYNQYEYGMRVYLDDGRVFKLDMPQQTNCILENYKLCHFHYANFPRFSSDLQRELRVYDKVQTSSANDLKSSVLNCTAESLLPDKYVSCVRQLLREGITPFPYKVAKALDPNMYRNIEFDAWNEARKEQRLQSWYNGDSNFKVGAKCHVRLRKSENEVYTCHIQEIGVDKAYCLVFVEELGEKRMVPYDALTPLPPDQFKPWSLPYRLQRHSLRFTRHYNYHLRFNGQFAAPQEYCSSGKSDNWDDWGDGKQQHHYHHAGAHHHHHHHGGNYSTAALTHKASCYYKLKQFTNLDNFHPPAIGLCAMPLTVETRVSTPATAATQAATPNTAAGTTAPTESQKGNENNPNSTAGAPQNCDLANSAPSEGGPNAGVIASVVKPSNETQKYDNSTPSQQGGGTTQILAGDDTLTGPMEQLVIDSGMPMGPTYLSELGYCYYPSYPGNYYTTAIDDYYGMPGAGGNGGANSGPGGVGYNYDYPVTYSGGTVYYMCPQQPAAGGYPFASNMYMPAHGMQAAMPPPHTPTTTLLHTPAHPNAAAAAAAGLHSMQGPVASTLYATPNAAAAAAASAGMPMHALSTTSIACSSAACFSTPAGPPAAHFATGCLPAAGGTSTTVPLLTPTAAAVSNQHHHYSSSSGGGGGGYNTPGAMTRSHHTRSSGGCNSLVTTQHHGRDSTTPLNGRVNWDAKKSIKTNGVDLPTDMATLRYFYNLGLDYHNQRKEASHNSDSGKNCKDLVQLDENVNQHEGSKSDANNNNAPNLNSQQGGTGISTSGVAVSGGVGGNPNYAGNNFNKNHFTRRFNTRYYSNKDRVGGGGGASSGGGGGPMNPRYGNSNSNAPSNTGGGGERGGGGIITPYSSHVMPQRQSQHNHDYNNNAAKGGDRGGGGNNYAHNKPMGGGSGGGNYNNPGSAGTTPNSSRQSSHPGNNGGGNSNNARNTHPSHAHSVEHLSAASSPFDGGASGANEQHITHQNPFNLSPHSILPLNYEQVGDGPQQAYGAGGGGMCSGPAGTPQQQIPPPTPGGGNGMFIPMGHPPPPRFSVYTNAPPPNMGPPVYAAGPHPHQQQQHAGPFAGGCPPPPPPPLQFTQLPPPVVGLLPPLHAQQQMQTLMNANANGNGGGGGNGGSGGAPTAMYAQSNCSDAGEGAGNMMAVGGGDVNSANGGGQYYQCMSYPPPPPQQGAPPANGAVHFYAPAYGNAPPPPPHMGPPAQQYYWNPPQPQGTTAANPPLHTPTNATNTSHAASANESNNAVGGASTNRSTAGQQTESSSNNSTAPVSNAAPSSTTSATGNASNTASAGTNNPSGGSTNVNTSNASAAPIPVVIAKRNPNTKPNNNK